MIARALPEPERGESTDSDLYHISVTKVYGLKFTLHQKPFNGTVRSARVQNLSSRMTTSNGACMPLPPAAHHFFADLQ